MRLDIDPVPEAGLWTSRFLRLTPRQSDASTVSRHKSLIIAARCEACPGVTDFDTRTRFIPPDNDQLDTAW